VKWKAKTPANPNFGDKIVQKQFAFLPTRVGEHWVWLESYYEMFIYRVAGDSVLGYYATYPHPTRAMYEQAFMYKLDTGE